MLHDIDGWFPPSLRLDIKDNFHHDIVSNNKKYFQKVSFCVLTHLIGQTSRAVCKKNMITMEMHVAQSTSCSRAASYQSHIKRLIDREHA